MQFPEKISKMVEHFSRWPGVGEKTAIRYVLSLLRWNHDDLHALSSAIAELTLLKRCQECGLISEETTCDICKNHERFLHKTICVVEGVADCFAIERSGEFKGAYHILGGVLSPLQQIGPNELTIDKLLLRIERRDIREVILALNPSVEGDITCSYLRDVIPLKVRVERIGMGIPMGGNLEHLDVLTIHKALENRRSL
ncbi:MAG: recombination protein RecR [Oligoflexia bacterium]|nr:recombination protein RecR [Oligoflexia bacterium]MBF0364785.1 recombination protein RecR [Oligoflexia bacterium]